MKRFTFHLAVFAAAAFTGAQAEQPHLTMTNGCVDIAVPTAIYHDALEAGLRDWMDMQCGAVSV